MTKEFIKVLRNLEIAKGVLLLKKFDEATSLIEKLLEEDYRLNERQLNNKEIIAACEAIHNLNYGIALDNLEQAIKRIKSYVFRNDCRVNWDLLTRTDNNDIRFCRECRKNVYKVVNDLELSMRAHNSQCVAIKTNDFINNSSIEYDENKSICIVDIKNSDNVLLGNPF